MSRWILAVALTLIAAPAAAANGDSGAEGKSGGPKESVAMPKLDAPPDAPSPFRVSVGPLAASRSMELEGNDGRVVHRPSPYLGGRIAVSGTLTSFESLQATLRFDGDLGYGVSKSSGGPLPGKREVVTELMFGEARLLLLRQLTDRVHAGVGAGIHSTSVILQPNFVYTGHRYIAAETGVRVRWRAIPGLMTAAAEAAAYPVLSTANSDGAHGTAQSFGGRLGAEWTLRMAPNATDAGMRGFRLVARYRFQRFRSQFPRSPIGPRGGISVDSQHVGALLVEYAVPGTGG